MSAKAPLLAPPAGCLRANSVGQAVKLLETKVLAMSDQSLSRDEVLDIFKEADALLNGHFILSSGLHSPVFLQKMLVFQRPDLTEKLCAAIAHKVRAVFGDLPKLVVAPAVGAIIPGYETARQLGLPGIFVERENGKFALRRGFSIEPGTKVIVVEDIVTTGLSSRECIECVRENGGEVMGLFCIIDRSAGQADVGVPLHALAEYEVPAYPADALPPELAKLPAVKPGSRSLKS